MADLQEEPYEDAPGGVLSRDRSGQSPRGASEVSPVRTKLRARGRTGTVTDAADTEDDASPEPERPRAAAEPTDTAARVRRLLAEHPVADGHSGLTQALSSLAWHDLELGESALQTDLPRLRKGGVGAVFWSLRVPDDATSSDRPVRATLELIDVAEGVARDHTEGLCLVRSASEIADARDRKSVV